MAGEGDGDGGVGAGWWDGEGGGREAAAGGWCDGAAARAEAGGGGEPAEVGVAVAVGAGAACQGAAGDRVAGEDGDVEAVAVRPHAGVGDREPGGVDGVDGDGEEGEGEVLVSVGAEVDRGRADEAEKVGCRAGGTGEVELVVAGGDGERVAAVGGGGGADARQGRERLLQRDPDPRERLPAAITHDTAHRHRRFEGDGDGGVGAGCWDGEGGGREAAAGGGGDGAAARAEAGGGGGPAEVGVAVAVGAGAACQGPAGDRVAGEDGDVEAVAVRPHAGVRDREPGRVDGVDGDGEEGEGEVLGSVGAEVDRGRAEEVEEVGCRAGGTGEVELVVAGGDGERVAAVGRGGGADARQGRERLLQRDPDPGERLPAAITHDTAHRHRRFEGDGDGGVGAGCWDGEGGGREAAAGGGGDGAAARAEAGGGGGPAEVGVAVAVGAGAACQGPAGDRVAGEDGDVEAVAVRPHAGVGDREPGRVDGVDGDGEEGEGEVLGSVGAEVDRGRAEEVEEV